MPDGDGINADENLLDQQLNNLLPFHDIHCLGPAGEPRPELSQTFDQSQIPFLIGGRFVQSLEFRLRRAELLAQWIDSLAQFVKRQEAFLVGR